MSRISLLLTNILRAHGVRTAIISPGARSSAIVESLAASAEIEVRSVVDERSAAFIALGIAEVTQSPVALVCTSGSAVLNYAPAISEAYYRHIPLIVISADRERMWVDQNDGQTIRQTGVLANIVKESYDLPTLLSGADRDGEWHCDRLVNDALLKAMSQPCGPVHINVQISLRPDVETDLSYHRQQTGMITAVMPENELKVSRVRELSREFASPRKVMVVAGFMAPDKRLNQALAKLAAKQNVIVMAEPLANLHNSLFVHSVDSALHALVSQHGAIPAEAQPDVVITLGGGILSAPLKRWLRQLDNCRFVSVGRENMVIDCFRNLTMNIETDPGVFMQQLASAMQPHDAPSGYSDLWQHAARRGDALLASAVAHSSWCEMKAMSVITALIPRSWNIQLSNGLTVRYYSLLNNGSFHRCSCNRGVSGIDGCTSTAIGASLVYKAAPTLLVSGDMCALYDLSAFASGLMTPRFKMVVVDNGGGGIFHFSQTTRTLNCAGECLISPPGMKLPLEDLAKGFGLKYFEAYDEKTLRLRWGEFAAESRQPALMRIVTDGVMDAEKLSEFLN